MSWHGYVGMENLALNDAQRATLIDALKALGNQTGSLPHLLSHRRVRLDGQAVIFEAEFADNNLTALAIRTYLANVFGIPVSQIAQTTTQTNYGPMLTLRRNAINYIRMVLFGGVGSTWEQSRQVALAYLFDFSLGWESTE